MRIGWSERKCDTYCTIKQTFCNHTCSTIFLKIHYEDFAQPLQKLELLNFAVFKNALSLTENKSYKLRWYEVLKTKFSHIFLHFYFLLHKQKKGIGFVKIFYFQFLMNLYVLGCPKHDLPISGKMSVFVYVTKNLWQV